MSDLKQRLAIASQKAEEIDKQGHVSAEIKSVVREMRDICEGFNYESSNAKDGSADARFMKKKLEQSVKDVRTMEIKMEEVKKTVGELIAEIKVISGEVGQLLKRHTPEAGDDDCFSALKIKAATQKMAELIVKLSSGG